MNAQNFVYYADTDTDGILLAGEPVVVARWQGNTGVATLELHEHPKRAHPTSAKSMKPPSDVG